MRALFSAVLAIAFTSTAISAQPTGPYFGALFGQADISRDITIDYTYSTKKFGWGAVLGWQWNQNFAFEAEYLRPGKISETVTDGSDTATVSAKFQGLTASGLFTFPLSERWSAHARLGAVRGREHYTATVNGTSAGTFSDNTTDLLYGGGFGVMVEGAKIRLDYQRAEFDAGKFSLISLGLIWYVPPRD